MSRLVPLLLVILIHACDPPVQKQESPVKDPYHEQFIRTNRYMQMRHQDEIAAFLERVGWEARRTSSGLWIVVEEEGSGPLILENDMVEYTYSSSLLDGTPCYSARIENPKQIIVGKGNVESGVDEGLMLLKNAGSAILLIPPHLAHGNFGDRNLIPGNSVLIYKIEIRDVLRGG